MNTKIMSILLVFLLSISITACSNDKSSSNVDNNTNVSNIKSSDISISTSPSPTPINASSDSKTESTNTQVPAENNMHSAMEAYKAVLQNKAEFFSTENKKNVYLNVFLTNEEIFGTTFKVTHFAVLDMDDDKIPEVVLELTVGYPDFIEVLHFMNGEVYGYIFSNRQLGRLKNDGTFGWAGSASYNGFGKLRFLPNACETDRLGYRDSSNNNGPITTIYYINNKQVTEESYNSFDKEERGKKDVDWYEFTQENIKTNLSIGS